MLITAYTVDYLTPRRVRIAWTGTLGLFSWMFINGQLVEGPNENETTALSLDVAVSAPFCVEIHETALDETADRIAEPLVRRPTVFWTARTAAEKYRLYHRPKSGGAERVIVTITEDGETLSYDHKFIQDLRQEVAPPLNGGVWNSYRVEAQSERGVESVRTEIPLFVAGLPKRPTSLTAAGATGVFTLTLGVA
jgi:hypothetical protein